MINWVGVVFGILFLVIIYYAISYAPGKKEFKWRISKNGE